METKKEQYIDELRLLLDQWTALLAQQNALEVEYTKLRDQITRVCNALDEIARNEARS